MSTSSSEHKNLQASRELFSGELTFRIESTTEYTVFSVD